MERQMRASIQQDIKTSMNEAVVESSVKTMAAAQEQLQAIKADVGAVKSYFHSPKTRGKFGENHLEQLLRDSMGGSKVSCEFQKTLSNHKRVDCIVKMPFGVLPIDAKFPLEVLQPILSGDDNNRTSSPQTKKQVHDTMRKHIKDICSKYILPGETTDYALCYLPSESVFMSIVSNFPALIATANRDNVYLASPTTLMPLISQLNASSRSMALMQLNQGATDETKDFSSSDESHEEMLNLLKVLFAQVELLEKNRKTADNSLDKAVTALNKLYKTVGKIQKVKADLDLLVEERESSANKNQHGVTNTTISQDCAQSSATQPIINGDISRGKDVKRT